MQNELKNILRYLKNNTGPGINTMSRITPNIFISDYETSLDIDMLKIYEIKTVIDVSNLNKNTEILKLYEKNKITNTIIKVPKDLDLLTLESFIEQLMIVYDIMVKEINKKNKILIHCEDGVNISPIYVIFFMLKRFYITNFNKNNDIIDTDILFLLKIIKFIKDRRICVEPDANFIMQLLKIEYALKDFYIKSAEIISIQAEIDNLKHGIHANQ
jgi:protein tyrosine phosphatase